MPDTRTIRRLLVLATVPACAAAITACGSGAHTASPSSTAAPATVTRTVTRSSTTAASRSQPTTQTSSSSSSTTPTTSTTAEASVPQCLASGLALSWLGGSAATGHVLLAFGLRNTSGHACVTGGYPGVLFLDTAGTGLPTTPEHTTDDFFGQTVLRTLRLSSGGLASFRLGVVDVGTGNSGGGGCEHAAGLQVIPPNNTSTLRIDHPIDECGATVSVSPLQAGSSALH